VVVLGTVVVVVVVLDPVVVVPEPVVVLVVAGVMVVVVVEVLLEPVAPGALVLVVAPAGGASGYALRATSPATDTSTRRVILNRTRGVAGPAPARGSSRGWPPPAMPIAWPIRQSDWGAPRANGPNV
jgi:hypothetical protein